MIKKLVLLCFSSLVLIGCGSNNVVVKQQVAELISDKSKGYVLFIRNSPDVFSKSYELDIVEFDPSTFLPVKNAFSIDRGEKTLFSVEEGLHYFYTNFRSNKHIVKLNVKKGELKTVNVGWTEHTILTPIVFDDSRLKLAKKILNMECNNENLQRYSFTDITPIASDEDDFDRSPSYKKGITVYKSPLSFKILCDKKQVTSINDLYHGASPSEIKELEFVKWPDDELKAFFKNDAKDFQKDIKALFPLYIQKLNKIAFSEAIVPLEIQEPADNYFNSFDSINLKVIAKSEDVNNKEFEDFKSKASELKPHSSLRGKALNVRLEVYRLDAGSQAGRYFTSGFSMLAYYKSLGTIGVDVIYEDSETGQIIGKVRLSGIEAGGALGGFNTLSSDVLDYFQKYTKATYMH